MIKTGRALSIVLMLAASTALGLSTLFLLVVGFCGGFPPGTGGLEPGLQVPTRPFGTEALGSRIREMLARP